jgi:50S ribosomal protein L16 3-hydroxylase
LPIALSEFAQRAVAGAIRRPGALERALGEWLTEPKPNVWFDAADGDASTVRSAIVLDRRTRMACTQRHVFINGESFAARGRDARLVGRLADARRLCASDMKQLSDGARALIAEWLAAGWLHVERKGDDGHA